MLTKLEQIKQASLNASLAAIVERLDKFDERLCNVEDGLLLVLNSQEYKSKSKAKKQLEEK